MMIHNALVNCIPDPQTPADTEIAKNLQLHTSILGVGSKLTMIDDAKPS